ncbi:hypothetical protein MUY14_20910 [Amycolatopsis sp. FBCC-B4732]|uniref:hypothetical protein n=1 Tax=Amycolatopsis sp. FBCC-B4732 TaxID=3079339 RepID=UPI001FF6F9D8|nr:hypothetical protein [Amycolatopsis sp. FBCC-B4732]UOX92955.1 hypothetical protein MUY14_20910 [Amycolatopsis sp. FBCC-B4732]
MGATGLPDELNHRARAMLRAVAAGRAEIACSCEPDLYIDGLVCCDQYTAHELAHRGLLAPARPGWVGQRVRARLTPAGAAALGTVGEAA